MIYGKEIRNLGLKDNIIWELAVREKAVLITRDYHFTNTVRFPSKDIGAIIYIRHGNLKASEEIEIILDFLKRHLFKEFENRLVVLSKYKISVR